MWSSVDGRQSTVDSPQSTVNSPQSTVRGPWTMDRRLYSFYDNFFYLSVLSHATLCVLVTNRINPKNKAKFIETK